MATATRAITAFLDGPDDLSISNIIHSSEGAARYGFRGALVGGVTVYGWTVPAILEALGETWLDSGWADIHFRRPVHPGDELTVAVEPGAAAFLLEVTNAGGEICIRGEVGLGAATWLHDLASPARVSAEPRPSALPRLTPESAPVSQDLRPMAVSFPSESVATYARDLQLDDSALWAGPAARIHPAQLAARMTPLLHHSYDYGPAIHARSQVQHLARAAAGQTITVAGHFCETYERKGHHYGIVDGLILSETGQPIARIRHTTIYQVASG